MKIPLIIRDEPMRGITEKILSKSVPQLNGCILWVGPVDRWGYGRITCRGNSRGVHRLIFSDVFGELSESDVIRHTCDTPNCVNIKHLLRGAHADNVRDRCERNRSATGSKNGRSKLNEESARKIFLDDRSQRVISSEYGVDARVVSRIKRRESWITATQNLRADAINA